MKYPELTIPKVGRLNQINYIIIPSDKQLVSVRSLCLYMNFLEKKTTSPPFTMFSIIE